jgi:FkbM family methyltransferase
MRFYSQLNQDRFIYETFFKDRPVQGVFVDVGAYDGVTISNTLFFEQTLGWTGLCIEPLPDAFAKLKASRRVPCLNYAVSDTPGTATFLDIDMPSGFEKMFSGIKADYDERHMRVVQGSNGRVAREIKVEVRRLDDLLDAHGITRIDYLSIDTEGSEWKIIRDLDFQKYDIHLISLENNFQDVKYRKHLANAGYELGKIFHTYDELYAKESWLKENPPNLIIGNSN